MSSPFRMQTSAVEAVALETESPATEKLYGLDQPETEYFGRQCLMARRLVERGVRFVQIYSGGGQLHGELGSRPFILWRHGCRGQTDQPMRALSQGLI